MRTCPIHSHSMRCMESQPFYPVAISPTIPRHHATHGTCISAYIDPTMRWSCYCLWIHREKLLMMNYTITGIAVYEVAEVSPDMQYVSFSMHEWKALFKRICPFQLKVVYNNLYLLQVETFVYMQDLPPSPHLIPVVG